MSDSDDKKCEAVFKAFFPAKICKTRSAKRPKRIRFFCNTAVKENDMPRSLVESLKLKDDREDGKVSAYVIAPGADRVKANFIVVEDQTRPDGVYNLGLETLRRMKAKIDCAGYASGRRRTRSKPQPAPDSDEPASCQTSDGGSPSHCPVGGESQAS